MNAFGESRLREALRTATAARKDGLAEDGPVRIRMAIRVIEMAATPSTIGMTDTKDSAFVNQLVNLSHTALKLFHSERRKAARQTHSS